MYEGRIWQAKFDFNLTERFAPAMFVKFASASEPFLEDAQSHCIRSLSQDISQDISQGISQNIFTARVMSGF